MSEQELKPDFVFHLPNKVKFTKEQHEQFNKELNRVTKLINASERTALLTKLRDEVLREKEYFSSYASQTLTRTVNSEYETGTEIFRKVLALLEKAGE